MLGGPVIGLSLFECVYLWMPAGYRWERQLVFRSKLTMHTAFDRKDNAHPAEITSLAISK